MRPNSALSPAKKLLTTRSGSRTPPGTDRLAFGGPRFSGYSYSLTYKGQPARQWATYSVVGLSSPPCSPTEPIRQSIRTTRWMGYVRCPGARFCGSLGGFEDLNGPREAAGPSRDSERRFHYMRPSEAVKPHQAPRGHCQRYPQRPSDLFQSEFSSR